jgi:CheY-like chemotaxis protein
VYIPSRPSRSPQFPLCPLPRVSKKRILLVENLADYCSLVTALLSDFEIVCAGSGVEAVQIIQSPEKFDLYLMDYYLPGGNGFGLCTTLRAIDEKTPILVLVSDAILRKDVIAAGAQGVIRTQHLASQLPQRVSELLG